ncbi:MAG: hypothetical protein K1V86_02865 [Duncaniella sp.]
MRLSHLLAISLCGISSVACHVDEIEVPSEELFTRSFIKEFGIADSDQDWTLATRVTMHINPSAMSGAETVSIYDRMPGTPGCQLAARFSASAETFAFDFAKSNSSAYVQGVNSDGKITFSGYYPIRDGILSVSTRSRAVEYTDASSIRLQEITGDSPWGNGFGSFNPNEYEREGMQACNFHYWNTLKGWNGAIKYKPILDVFSFYGMYSGGTFNDSYLKGCYDDIEEGTPCSTLIHIVGEKGVFHEGVVDGHCNINLYSERLKPEDGVIYRSDGGEIVLKYVYGAGIFSNSFGYFYYPEGATTQQIMEAPKFMLMYDASPWNNLQRNAGDGYSNFENIGGHGTENKTILTQVGIDNYSGMRTANDVNDYENNSGKDVLYKPSYHKLVYYELDSDNKPIEGSATYTFPKGMNIGFFILVQGHEKLRRNGSLEGLNHSSNNSWWKVEGVDVRFSIPWMNQLMGAYYKSVPGHGNTTYDKHALDFSLNDGRTGSIPADYTPHMSFVTFAYNGHTVLGVEDGQYHNNDHDVNDMLFYVEGVNDDQEEIGEKPQVQSWIIGCEDLGSSFDFDFNDTVFGVSHFSTDDKSQNYLKVKALAAGGTLPIQLLWTDPAGTTHNVGTDYDKTYLRWNNWFGVDNVSQIINCNHSNDGDAYEGATVTIPLDRFPDYTITADNFKDGTPYLMGGFSLAVYDNTGFEISREVKPIGNYKNDAERWTRTPQMILVHSGWKWPVECRPIFDAYDGRTSFGDSHSQKMSGFRDWVQDKFAIDWTEHISTPSYVTDHRWTGEAEPDITK